MLPAGTTLTLDGFVYWPDCGKPMPDEFVFAVPSIENGESTEDIIVVSNPEDFAPAFAEWCAQDPAVALGMSSVAVDGTAKVVFEIVNPGPNSVVVEVRDFSADGAHWDAASVTAEPGKLTRLTVHGTGVRQNASQPVPWENGDLLIDGRPYKWTDPNSWI